MSLARDLMVDNTLERIEDVVGVTELAEREGYDRAWMGESWGRDAVTPVTLMCDATEDIGIGTSILPVYSRTPAMIGQTAATLQEVADGRMRIGLGPSGPAVIEHWHGVDFERPLRRTREYVEIVQAITRGEVVKYDGEFVEMGGSVFGVIHRLPSPLTWRPSGRRWSSWRAGSWTAGTRSC
jgi:alkanesulfonate monooxygenase SsuD/methylene tetrahydromethanopterin reductase-like flavin-dependent oxidoreductase (luciferase family)